jgi:hypothetical protein
MRTRMGSLNAKDGEGMKGGRDALVREMGREAGQLPVAKQEPCASTVCLTPEEVRKAKRREREGEQQEDKR